MPLHNFPNIGKIYSTVRARDKNESHCGKVIAAGAENAHVPEMLAWERADNLTEAIAMALWAEMPKLRCFINR